MAAWRNLAAALVALVVVQTGWTQTYQLSETAQAGDCFRLRLDLTVSGDINFSKDGKQLTLKQEVSAMHEFPERVMSVSMTGLPDKVARVYEKARSSVSINGEGSERRLRAERRLLVAQRQKDQTLVYSPAGTLTRGELELTDHFDTLVLTGLLPGREVAVGETIFHEGGHAFHALATREEDLFNYRSAPIEFCEVASMSMELLGNEFLAKFYSAPEANRARRTHLEGVVNVFPWIATVDAFQHWVYTHPSHTRKERTAAWPAGCTTSRKSTRCSVCSCRPPTPWPARWLGATAPGSSLPGPTRLTSSACPNRCRRKRSS